ncbi:hypothetical protein DFH94DRAFT_686827 [Russula ochroleuca]|uniref:Uncharacterized protein n=1 Tax=Russula ochroleuca TaxID=152965 RepID=A0A9P5JUC5_9AGAM|nr:hypothetical protein DFH94DRAFT_686827 [Russula ochroleuca]
MSLLATPLTFLLFFSGFTVAQIVSPNCESTWSWSFNSLNQDPCKVAATMLGTCNGNTFTIGPLQPGYSYYGPSGVDDSNLCKCSTVGYSLLSACGGCQGASWITWSEYAFNCTKTLPSPQFPNAVPSGIRVPHWALLDPTYENLWDFNQSYIAGDTPEVLPGQVPGSPASSSSLRGSSTPTTAPAGIPTATGGHSSNGGAIAGGIVGGLAAISLVVAGLLFYRRRRRLLASSAMPESAGANVFPHMDQVPRPMSDHETLASSFPETTSLMKPYCFSNPQNPDDPSTYPAFPGTPNGSYIPSQTTPLTSSRNLYTVATMPSPQPQGYPGLPMV